jgi:DNA invertase Pin-like site-specific DNA recombinase
MTAAVYARKSTDQNGIADDAKSVARQIEHAKAYAVRKGWTAPRVRLPGRSADFA